MKKKSSRKASFWAVARVAFIALCFVALGALLLNPPHSATVAAGTHIHSSSLTGPGAADSAGTVNGVPAAVQRAQGSASPSSGTAVKDQQPGASPSGETAKGQPAKSPADGGSAAANSPQRSLKDAADEPNGLAAHPKAPNPAPSPRGTVDPSQVLDTASQSLGGCLKEYGDAGQCLSVVPPSLAEHVQQMKNAGLDPTSMPHDWTCTEVRVYFPQGITVRQAGVDPQHLDHNGDGIACGVGD